VGEAKTMIEFMRDSGDKWMRVPDKIIIVGAHFNKHIFKINDIVYKEYTSEFKEQFNKHRMWVLLSD